MQKRLLNFTPRLASWALWGLLSSSAAWVEITISTVTSPPFRQYLTDPSWMEVYRNIAALTALYAAAGLLSWILVWCFSWAGGGEGEAFFLRNTVAVWGALVLSVYGFWAIRKFLFLRSAFTIPGFILCVILEIGVAAILGTAVQKYFSSSLKWNSFFLLMLVTAAAPLLSRFPQAETASPSVLPNVILLSVDTLRPDHLGCMGYPKARTPHIDRLAERGLVFRQAYAQIPLTAPSFCSIMTGLYPKTHGCRANLTLLDPSVVTWAELLSKSGYETAAFVSGYPLKRELCGLSKGFGFYQDRFSFFDGFKLLRFLERWHLVELQLERRADRVSPLSIPWMRRHAGHPFFVWIHYYDPHVPYRPPLSPSADPSLRRFLPRQQQLWGKKKEELPPGAAVTMEALYDGEISFVDEDVGRTLSFLESTRLRERTLIIFVSDHGEGIDHDYYFDHGDRLYESCIRIAAMVSYPGAIPERTVSERVIQSIDLFPTVVSLLGLPEHPCEGKSLFERNAFSEGPSSSVYAELSRRRGYPTLGDLWSLREGPWKLIYSPEGRLAELYHLSEDSQEATNLSSKETERTKEMTEKLVRWMSEKREPERLEPEGLTREKLKSLGYLQ